MGCVSLTTVRWFTAQTTCIATMVSALKLSAVLRVIQSVGPTRAAANEATMAAGVSVDALPDSFATGVRAGACGTVHPMHSAAHPMDVTEPATATAPTSATLPWMRP